MWQYQAFCYCTTEYSSAECEFLPHTYSTYGTLPEAYINPNPTFGDCLYFYSWTFAPTSHIAEL